MSNELIEKLIQARSRKAYTLPVHRQAVELLRTVTKYWYRKKKDLVRFVIFGQGRSGSTLLDSLLDSHSEVSSCDELLRMRSRFPWSHLEWSERKASATKKAFGFHLKPWHVTRVQELDLDEFTDELIKRDFRFVHLKRENWFLKSLSQVKLHMYRVVHARTDSQVPDKGLFVDPELLVFLIKEKQEQDETESIVTSKLSYRPEEVIYERDLLTPEQQQATASRIFAFLGLSDAKVSTPLRKVSPKDWRLGVSNAEEIEQAVREAGYGRFLA